MCSLEAHPFEILSINYARASLCIGTFREYAIILDTTFKLGRQQEKIIVHSVGLHDH
jgi:hypothetical protein